MPHMRHGLRAQAPLVISIQMLRLRFASGLILGLVLGVPAGTVIGLAVLPRSADPSTATTSQVQELTRQLASVKDDKAVVDRQLEQFAKMADQMTVSFDSLERRFKALEEEARLRDTHPAPAAPSGPAPTHIPAPPAGASASDPAPQPQAAAQ